MPATKRMETTVAKAEGWKPKPMMLYQREAPLAWPWNKTPTNSTAITVAIRPITQRRR